MTIVFRRVEELRGLDQKFKGTMSFWENYNQRVVSDNTFQSTVASIVMRKMNSR